MKRAYVSFLLLPLLAGCATTGQQFNLLTAQEEKALGAELSAQIEQREKILQDAQIQNYVRGIGQRLASVVERRDVDYRFTVIDAPDTVNAFALPGGHMYIYSGLLKLASNEAELAGVMAHEIAHVSSYHHGEALTRQYGYNMIAGALLGESPGALAAIGAQIAGTGGQNYYSRASESEADAKGMDYLFYAGYRPEAMVTFMEKMGGAEQRRPAGFFYALMASHPATPERVQRLLQLVQRYPMEQRRANTLGDDAYRQNVLSRLR